MNILILHRKDITNPHAGGGTLYIHRVARYLVQKGHSVTFLCANYVGGRKREIIDGVNIVRLGNRYSVYPLAFIYYVKKLRKKMDVLIDVIDDMAFFTPLYSSIPKIALIHQTSKEVFLLEYNKILSSIMYLMEKMIAFIYRNVPTITPSFSVKKELVNNGFPKKNIFVVPPGIDLEKYGLSRKSVYPIVLYVGRLKKYKGVEFLIQAMKEVIKKIPDAKLLIVGKGDHMKSLIEYTRKLGLKCAVEFSGYVSEEEKIQHMQRAHVIVLPSVKEGWGIPIIEAAACGTPAIGSDTTGLKDSIINEKTGFLVPYGNPEILAEKIVECLRNDHLRERLGKNAIRWARNFEWEKMLYRIETIITALGKKIMCI